MSALKSLVASFCSGMKSGLIYMLIIKVNRKVNLLKLALRIDNMNSICGSEGVYFFFFSQEAMNELSSFWKRMVKKV